MTKDKRPALIPRWRLYAASSLAIGIGILLPIGLGLRYLAFSWVDLFMGGALLVALRKGWL